MNYKKKKRIRELTHEILDMFQIDIPIKDIREVTRKLGGTVIDDAALSQYADAYIKKTAEGFRIYVPSRMPKSRENLTVARALGHLFINMGYMISKELWASTADEYRPCSSSMENTLAVEIFALSFLMPQDRFRRVMNENIMENGRQVNVSGMARYFETTVDAVLYLGKDLGYFE